MASRINRPNGHRWIQFTDVEGKRKTIRLGKMPPKNADTIKGKVEALLACQLIGCLPDEETARWLASAPTPLVAKLAKAGLVEKRIATTIDELCAFCKKHLTCKSTTAKNEHRHTRRHLRKHFGPGKSLQLITPTDAQHFYDWLRSEEGPNLAESTAGKRCEKAKGYFSKAVGKRWLASSPFENVKTNVKANRDRDRTIERESIDKILEEIIDPRFELVVRLCRFGGLRQMEPFDLRLDWINWEEDTIRVWASKTQSWRVVPMFPEIRPQLYKAVEDLEEGQQLLMGDWRPSGSALTGRLKRVMDRLGLGWWPKPWHNMRATRENELRDIFPSDVVYAWIGHDESTAREHYLRVTKEHIRRATRPEANSEAHSATASDQPA